MLVTLQSRVRSKMHFRKHAIIRTTIILFGELRNTLDRLAKGAIGKSVETDIVYKLDYQKRIHLNLLSTIHVSQFPLTQCIVSGCLIKLRSLIKWSSVVVC